MTRQHGYSAWTDRASGSVTVERDTIQCRHCQAHVFVKPGTVSTVYLVPDFRQPSGWREEPGAWCAVCNGPVCLPCHDVGTCRPFMVEIERSETGTAMRDARARLGYGPALESLERKVIIP